MGYLLLKNCTLYPNFGPLDLLCFFYVLHWLGSKVLYVARAQKKTERKQILRREYEDRRREQVLKYGVIYLMPFCFCSFLLLAYLSNLFLCRFLITQQNSNVYIKNIDDDVTDEELREHFGKCGTITSTKIMRDEKGVSKGFGFICFSTPDEAINAVRTFHGKLTAVSV